MTGPQPATQPATWHDAARPGCAAGASALHLSMTRLAARAVVVAAILTVAVGCGGPPPPTPPVPAAEAPTTAIVFPPDVITFQQDLAWSPDSRRIAFSLRAIPRDRWAELKYDALAGTQYDLYVVGADGRGLRQLTDDADDQLWASWLPDGRQLAYASTAGGKAAIFALRPDDPTPTPRAITPPLADTADTAWSPDGQRVVYSAKVDAHSQLYMATLIGTDVRQLTRDPFDHRGPVWSADGTALVFQGNPRGPGRDDIFVLHVATEVVTQVTNDDAGHIYPGWLPDGRVTFTVVDRDGRKRVVAQGRDPAARETLVEGAFFARVSPDGRALAYILGAFPDASIYIRPIDPATKAIAIVE